MLGILQNLMKLQTIEFGGQAATEAEIAELRGGVPSQVLAHYDRLVARGKKGIAVIRNQVCTGCHMRLPIGTINTLMQGTDIQLCDSCGRYLYLPTPEELQTEAAAAAEAKPARKPRKRKGVAHVV